MRNFWNRSTWFVKIIVIGAIGVGVFFGVDYLKTSGIIPTENEGGMSNSEIEEYIEDGATEINVCVVTWAGYAGGQYFNEGFKASEDSRFLKDYNLVVNFSVVDDFDASRKGFIAGEYDLLWQTTGAFTSEVESLEDSNIDPVIVFQADWSRGGDVIVARKGIKNINELIRGDYTVAVAPMTPSYTFLMKTLEAAGKSLEDIEVVEVASAIDAADLFKAGEVDAAVVWSPDDIACLESQSGSSVIISTETATNIIADVFYAKREWLDDNREAVQNLIEGWMIGASEINTDESARNRAVEILADGLNISEEDASASLDNVRLCTYGDNLNFFGINDDYNGVTGEELYSTSSKLYYEAGYAPRNVTSWRSVTDRSLIEDINLTGSEHLAEGQRVFEEVTEETVVEEVTNKPVSISFSTGSYRLDDNAKYIIDKEFVDIAKSFANARIKVAGNTDNTGSYSTNKSLSLKRAQAVVDYLIEEYGFDRNRFIVVGNGPDHAIEDNVSGASEDYRRTDFQLLK